MEATGSLFDRIPRAFSPLLYHLLCLLLALPFSLPFPFPQRIILFPRGQGKGKEKEQDIPRHEYAAAVGRGVRETQCRATDFIVAGKLRVIGVVINSPPSYIGR